MYFWNKTRHVSDSSSVRHQEFFAVHTAMVNVIQDYWQLASRIDGVPSWSCTQAVIKPVWHIPLLCVQWKNPDNGQRNCPKHVEFYSKNTFEKLVHLVDFVIRTSHAFFFQTPSNSRVSSLRMRHQFKSDSYLFIYFYVLRKGTSDVPHKIGMISE